MRVELLSVLSLASPLESYSFRSPAQTSRVLAAEPDAHTCQIYGRKGACLRSGAAVSETGAAVILSQRLVKLPLFFKQSWFEWLECDDLLD